MYGIYLNEKLKKVFENLIDAYEAAKRIFEETGIFHEVRSISEATAFNAGDKVKHTEQPYGTGIVQGVSKSGKRVRVKWGNDWDRKRLLFTPYDGYYRPDKLKKID